MKLVLGMALFAMGYAFMYYAAAIYQVYNGNAHGLFAPPPSVLFGFPGTPAGKTVPFTSG